MVGYLKQIFSEIHMDAYTCRGRGGDNSCLAETPSNFIGASLLTEFTPKRANSFLWEKPPFYGYRVKQEVTKVVCLCKMAAQTCGVPIHFNLKAPQSNCRITSTSSLWLDKWTNSQMDRHRKCNTVPLCKRQGIVSRR